MRRRMRTPEPPQPGCPLCGKPLFHGPFCWEHKDGWHESPERRRWCAVGPESSEAFRLMVERYTKRVQVAANMEKELDEDDE